ncbi:atrial natriuretic peptide receptor 1-like [Crassostrea angulata]|uniref:atrial natriuretic peptide receptor 1-like n=1 Tax=Magallana angulata TaxID=2784310 RepID=UPI0022B08D3C|nr:atrial natriuretic peptide receptor 1-like [Crassostrea angulata]
MFVQVYLLLSLNVVLAERERVRVGVFQADDTVPFGIHRSGPAVDLGVQKLKEFVGKDMDVEIINYLSLQGSECDPTRQGLFGKIAAEMHHLKNITAIIGPTCSVAMEFIGRMAAEWNIPVFATSGAYEVLDDKTIFKTLTRLVNNYNQLAQFYVEMFSYFNWTDVSVLYEGEGKRLKQTVYNVNTGFAKNIHSNILSAGLKSTLLQFSSETEDGYQNVLKEGNKTSRVYLVVCDNVALRWLLLTARSLGMTEGDHAFIYFFNFNGYINGNIMKKIGDEDEQAVKKAFESIFLIGLYQSQTKQYQEFSLQLKRRSLEQYNFSYFNEDPVCYGGATIPFQFSNSNTIHWPNGKGPPANKPRCGYTGDALECIDSEDNNSFMVLSIVLSVLIFSVCNIVFLIYRKRTKDAELLSSWWKIPWEEISWISQCYSRYSNLCLSEAKLKSLSDISSTSMIMNKKVAIYKSSKIVLHKFNKKQPPSSKSFYVELVQMKNINCHNLTKFLGLTEHDSGLYSVTEFCSRGDLRDILSNEAFVLNREFSISLIRDIIQAMEYLHSSNIRFHGSLHSRSCVIDSRFVLKVTNFGLQSLKDFNIDFHSEKCLWVAPELLRKSKTSSDCIEMQCADIYSFGIIIYEVVSRKEPYENEKEFLTLEEIVMNLKTIGDEQFRPQLDTTEIDKNVIDLMRNCWDEDPTCRPSFQFMRKQSRKLHWDKSGDRLLDMLLSRMEEYANNLEDLVEERTQSLIIEKRKSDELLYQILPRSVADKLKTGCMVEPEAYACVTIYFSDIVGFTSLSSQSTPLQVIDFLNDLYICFDKTIENFDVYKVETIGDAYMVVSGLPTRNGDQHVVEIARMSCSILENAKKFKIKHIPDHRLSVRIGIHSGPVCAGVVGQKMPRYCLFGDTVNTASRMESNGEPMRIHTSDNTRNLLNNHQDFLLEERGELQIKGKGIMRTYWLYLKADRNS